MCQLEEEFVAVSHFGAEIFLRKKLKIGVEFEKGKE